MKLLTFLLVPLSLFLSGAASAVVKRNPPSYEMVPFHPHPLPFSSCVGPDCQGDGSGPPPHIGPPKWCPDGNCAGEQQKFLIQPGHQVHPLPPRCTGDNCANQKVEKRGKMKCSLDGKYCVPSGRLPHRCTGDDCPDEINPLQKIEKRGAEERCSLDGKICVPSSHLPHSCTGKDCAKIEGAWNHFWCGADGITCFPCMYIGCREEKILLKDGRVKCNQERTMCFPCSKIGCKEEGALLGEWEVLST